jgi:DNA-binding SARP family transcriptional activator
LCEQLASVGDFTEALEAGVVAAAADPLRESAHRAVIKAHLAEGNQAEAVRQYHLCRDLLQTHLDATPSGRMEELVQDLLVG